MVSMDARGFQEEVQAEESHERQLDLSCISTLSNDSPKSSKWPDFDTLYKGITENAGSPAEMNLVAYLSYHPPAVCLCCRNLLERNITGDLVEVYESASRGCYSCTLLFHAARVAYSSFTSHELVSGIEYSGVYLRTGLKFQYRTSSVWWWMPGPDNEPWSGTDLSAEVDLGTISGEPESIWPQLQTFPKTQAYTLDALPRLKEWMEDCVKNHPECSNTPLLPPTRLIDVGSATATPFIWLPEGQNVPFVALSHCWGKSMHLRMIRSNLDAMKEAIPWDSLSTTFQDAVLATRELNIQYLWIDSLCIIQDDSNDWAIEASKMAQVYQGADLVLAATEASDGRYGFLTTRETTNFPKQVISGTNASGDEYSVYTRLSGEHDWCRELFKDASLNRTDKPQKTPLSSRAWVFQERLLATRYVHFYKREIVWECKSSLRCECGKLDGRKSRSVMKESTYNKDNPLSAWNFIVGSFAQLSLTYSSDCFPALSGIAKQFQAAGAGEYIAGLWKDTLLTGLLWSVGRYQGAEFFKTGHRRSEIYRAPTWSWASIENPCTPTINSLWFTSKESPSISSGFYGPSVPVASIVDMTCVLTGPDPSGQLSSASLTLCGPLLRVRYKNLPTLDENGWIHDSPFEFCDGPNYNPDIEIYGGPLSSDDFRVELDFGLASISPDTDIYCLFLVKTFYDSHNGAILLQKHGSQEGVYQRCGILEWCDHKPNHPWTVHFDNAPLSTVKIV